MYTKASLAGRHHFICLQLEFLYNLCSVGALTPKPSMKIMMKILQIMIIITYLITGLVISKVLEERDDTKPEVEGDARLNMRG